ncbi:hypothetical protein C4544_03455 [candidate division WS5 bacterium]|uniref:Homeodomain phBC6A51-type domain-containing protein n=1 Tax=candidate division WS5 bacterium TaxID=2093353 RepID=A0A419DDS7_9BACT|nr:MAG: hypothetical protein C4544_03455 [candidate division WS5 bacterium]
MKKNRKKDEFLEQLRKLPIVQICCDKVGLSRNSIYRWRKEDEEFRTAMAEALAEGETLITEMSESTLISLIKDKHFPAVQLWLRQFHPKFANKVELSGTLTVEDDEISDEEEQILSHLEKLVSFVDKSESQQNHESQQSSE